MLVSTNFDIDYLRKQRMGASARSALFCAKRMPKSAPKGCIRAGCGALAKVGSLCDAHRSQANRELDDRRGTAHERGYTAAWRAARSRWLMEHPVCATCLFEGRVVPALVVDHIRPHRGNYQLFWDIENWQSLCKPCHDRKTARGE